jgi:hypothetical protein
MQIFKFISTNRGFAILIVSGMILGVFAGIMANSLHSTGIVSTWELIESPFKFSNIVSADTTAVWAKSTEGTIYKWDLFECFEENDCAWKENEEIPFRRDVFEGSFTKFGNTCQFDEYITPRNEPGSVIQCALAYMDGNDLSQAIYYALLDDGTIWFWIHSRGSLNLKLLILSWSLTGIALVVVAGLILRFLAKRSLKRN